jgi:hypothetical protein
LSVTLGHDLLQLLARGMIEAFRDPSIIEAEIASQCRRRPAQIVRREWSPAEQRADPGRRSVDCRAIIETAKVHVLAPNDSDTYETRWRAIGMTY